MSTPKGRVNDDRMTLLAWRGTGAWWWDGLALVTTRAGRIIARHPMPEAQARRKASLYASP